MMRQPQTIQWRDGDVPVSSRFDDPYFSLENGMAEARHVFLAGNDLPARFAGGLHIAELGFGTGLNFLTCVDAWQHHDAHKPLRFTSFEGFPMSSEDMSRALAAFPELRHLTLGLLTVWSPEGGTWTPFPGVTLTVIIGDARDTLPVWGGKADAWFLDGFSPAKNPELWQPELMAEVARHTAPGGSAATYTAAGFVRRGLADAGFTVERAPGYGRKRHMTKASLP